MSARLPDAEGELDPRVEAWLDDGPDRAPAQFIDATLAPIPAMAQRRRSLVAIGRMTVTFAALARIAATAALVFGVGLAGLAIRGGPIGHEGPTETPSAAPTSLPNGVSYTNVGPLGAGSGNESGKAGTYETLVFRPAFRFTVPAHWSINTLVNTFVGGGEDLAGIPIDNGTGVIVVTTPTSVDPPAPGDFGTTVPADLVAWLVADPQLTLVGGPTPVTVGGFAGQQVEGSLAAGARLDPVEGFYRPMDYLPLLPREHFRIAVIRVGGQQVVVATIANADVFEVFRPEADAVIGSFEFPGS
jgi:hypothetical protein